MLDHYDAQGRLQDEYDPYDDVRAQQAWYAARTCDRCAGTNFDWDEAGEREPLAYEEVELPAFGPYGTTAWLRLCPGCWALVVGVVTGTVPTAGGAA